MIKLFAFMSTFTLLSCNPPKHVTKQCTVDLYRNSCFCRDYEFSLDFLGPLPGPYEKRDFMYCHKLVGFPSQNYTDVASFWGKVSRMIREELDAREAE